VRALTFVGRLCRSDELFENTLGPQEDRALISQGSCRAVRIWRGEAGARLRRAGLEGENARR